MKKTILAEDQLKDSSIIFSHLRKITPRKLKNFINLKIVDVIDTFFDRKITGFDLTKTIPRTIDIAEKGGTESQPAKYLILEKVFSHLSLSSSDSFIDVGCGQGRVSAFLIKNHCPCMIHGIEMSEEPGKIATEWAQKYTNISVILGDAFSLNYNDYTVLFLNQPFIPPVFYRFVQLLERQITHQITLIYLFDHASGGYLEGRSGWELQYREEFFRIHRLQVVAAVRRFSIWEYTPTERLLKTK